MFPRATLHALHEARADRIVHWGMAADEVKGAGRPWALVKLRHPRTFSLACAHVAVHQQQGDQHH